jgi:hypothetical protein
MDVNKINVRYRYNQSNYDGQAKPQLLLVFFNSSLTNQYLKDIGIAM